VFGRVSPCGFQTVRTRTIARRLTARRGASDADCHNAGSSRWHPFDLPDGHDSPVLGVRNWTVRHVDGASSALLRVNPPSRLQSELAASARLLNRWVVGSSPTPGDEAIAAAMARHDGMPTPLTVHCARAPPTVSETFTPMRTAQPAAAPPRWVRMTGRKTEAQFLRLIATFWRQMRDGWIRGAVPDCC
jgi:hypothetical protein